MEMVAGIVVAVAALALVLEPLVRGGIAQEAPSPADEIDFTDIQESESPKIRALLALKEIEFDRATGKLSDEDYAALKQRYAVAAMAAIKAEDAVAATDADVADGDPAEAAIQKARLGTQRVCPACGPRPESDTAFCSDCGKPLETPGAPGRCSSCGETIPAGGKFCANCGAPSVAIVAR